MSHIRQGSYHNRENSQTQSRSILKKAASDSSLKFPHLHDTDNTMHSRIEKRIVTISQSNAQMPTNSLTMEPYLKDNHHNEIDHTGITGSPLFVDTSSR